MRNEEGRISQQNRITAGFPVSGTRFATAAQPFPRLEIVLQRLRSLSRGWKSFYNRCKAFPGAGNHFAIVAKPFPAAGNRFAIIAKPLPAVGKGSAIVVTLHIILSPSGIRPLGDRC